MVNMDAVICALLLVIIVVPATLLEFGASTFVTIMVDISLVLFIGVAIMGMTQN